MSVKLSNEQRSELETICAHFDISTRGTLEELRARMESASSALTILMIFLRDCGESVYGLSRDSGLSVSAVKNRLGNESARQRLAELLSETDPSRYELVDLSRLSESAVEEIRNTHRRTSTKDQT